MGQAKKVDKLADIINERGLRSFNDTHFTYGLRGSLFFILDYDHN